MKYSWPSILQTIYVLSGSDRLPNKKDLEKLCILFKYLNIILDKHLVLRKENDLVVSKGHVNAGYYVCIKIGGLGRDLCALGFLR